LPSELETSLARTFGERLDTTVIEKPAAVEDDVADACCLGALSDECTRSLGLGRLIAVLECARVGGRGVVPVTSSITCT
jgi:hypothetical protein